VRFYSLEEADGQLFIVREYIDGKSLDDLVKNSPLSYSRMLRAGLELATVIKKLHENGLVHGNITAANLFTDEQERSRLTDLGLGLPIETWPANPPASIHDIPFLAPEILEGGRTSFATDQYAIGAVLYQMLTGQPPFYDEDPQTLIQAVLQEPVSFEIRPLSTVPGVARLLIGKLLAKKPEDRFVSTDELQFTLQGMLSLGAQPAPVTTEKRWTPSPRLYMLISVLAILLVILWLVVSNSSG
jgi:serine/threonine protein kinase